jgi:hypothetical protein
MPLILSGDTGVPASGMPTGSVIQTVSASNTTQFSTSSTSWTATPITASITPISSTSKILVAATMCWYGTGQGTINRGATNLGNATYGFIELNNTNAFEWSVAISYLDSPATTSSTTYTIYVKATSPYSVWTNINPTTTTITLQEIKG